MCESRFFGCFVVDSSLEITCSPGWCCSSLIGGIVSTVSLTVSSTLPPPPPPTTTSSPSSSTLLFRRCCRLLLFLLRLAIRGLPAEEELVKPSRAEDRRRDESRAFSSSTRARVPPSIHGRYTRASSREDAHSPQQTSSIREMLFVERKSITVRAHVLGRTRSRYAADPPGCLSAR